MQTPSKFNKKSADKFTNFNRSTDTLKTDTNSFAIDSAAPFASDKNKKVVKKKLAKQDFDFLYDEKKGGLYFNENGADKGFGDDGIIAILKGAPDLTSDNLEFIWGKKGSSQTKNKKPATKGIYATLDFQDKKVCSTYRASAHFLFAIFPPLQ